MKPILLGKTKTDRAIAAFALVGPTYLRQYYNARCCLNATWVLQQVLATYDIEVRPMVVDALFFNTPYWAKVQELGRLPTGKAEIDAWYAENGAHSVGTVRGRVISDDGWEGGHLVGVVKDILVDASARQFRRVEHALKCPDVIVGRVTPEFLAGTHRDVLQMEQGAMVYHAHPTDRSYGGAPGFEPSPENSACARQILQELKQQRIR